MTRRDFQLIARTLRDAEARASVRLAMSRALATTNPKFDHARFMRESEPQGYGSPNWKAGGDVTAGPVQTGHEEAPEAA